MYKALATFFVLLLVISACESDSGTNTGELGNNPFQGVWNFDISGDFTGTATTNVDSYGNFFFSTNVADQSETLNINVTGKVDSLGAVTGNVTVTDDTTRGTMSGSFSENSGSGSWYVGYSSGSWTSLKQ